MAYSRNDSERRRLNSPTSRKVSASDADRNDMRLPIALWIRDLDGFRSSQTVDALVHTLRAGCYWRVGESGGSRRIDIGIQSLTDKRTRRCLCKLRALVAFITAATNAVCSFSVPVPMRFTRLPVWVDDRRWPRVMWTGCVVWQAGRTKRHWIKTAHPTRARTHTHR